MNRTLLYWLLQISGWGIYSIFLFSLMIVFGGKNFINKSNIILQIIFFISLVGSSHLFRFFILKYGLNSLPIKKLIPLSIIGSFLSSLVAQVIIHVIVYLFIPLEGITEFSLQNFFFYVLSVFVVMCLWTAIYLFTQISRKNKQTEIEKLELENLLQEAELTILKNQINPHFIFNALNNIRSLVMENPQKAREMLSHISDLLRYSIQFKPTETVTLDKEVEIVTNYLELQSIHFSDRLSFNFDIDKSTKNALIPPMSIQLLVENAIKHGISLDPKGGTLKIISKLYENILEINVKNTGRLNHGSKPEGIGLENLIKRLNILFGSTANLSLYESTENTVTATLQVPYYESTYS